MSAVLTVVISVALPPEAATNQSFGDAAFRQRITFGCIKPVIGDDRNRQETERRACADVVEQTQRRRYYRHTAATHHDVTGTHA